MSCARTRQPGAYPTTTLLPLAERYANYTDHFRCLDVQALAEDSAFSGPVSQVRSGYFQIPYDSPIPRRAALAVPQARVWASEVNNMMH